MKYQITFLFPLLLLFSCLSSTDDTTNAENLVIGDWTGSEFHFKTDSTAGNGYFGNDFYITADSIFSMDYPTNSRSTTEHYELINDSIEFSLGKFELTVTDSILTLVGYTFGKKEQKDSMILLRSKFDLEVVKELKTNKYNLNILNSKNWKLDTLSTKSNIWKDSENEFLNPEIYIEWSNILYDSLNGGTIVFKADTFNIRDFYSTDYLEEKNEFRLSLGKDINGRKVKIYYTLNKTKANKR